MLIQGLNISKRLLWDIDASELDVKAHKSFLVARVLNRGSLDDIRSLLSFYSKNELTEAIYNNKQLQEKALHFIAQYLNLEVKELPCYEEIRLNPYLSAH